MRAIILAAGVGLRLGGGESRPPKCLLRFDGRSLLERHLATLGDLGVERVDVGVGYRAGDIEREIAASRCGLDVRTTYNADFHDGNVVTLHRLDAALRAGGDVLLMDADVLYHDDVLGALAATRHANCFLIDRDFEPGEEPVKLCLREGVPVEFGKRLPPGLRYDVCGESVGFFRLAEAMALRLADTVDAYVRRGAREAFYEDALRDLLLDSPLEFGVEDVTGMPWIEIDFPHDVRRAEEEVLAHIRAREAA